MGEERSLQARQGFVANRQSLHRLDASPRHLANRDQTGTDLAAIEQHRTSAAVTGVAAHLGAGEA
jgi:hypothetical protein